LKCENLKEITREKKIGGNKELLVSGQFTITKHVSNT
jgi:hypothetical protein